MMAVTHAIAGAALALPLVAVAPELAPVAALAGIAGGVFPDLDLHVDHRRLLHYPVYYAVAAVPLLAVAAFLSSPATVGLAFFAMAAAAHSLMDVLGGGLELRPWQNRSERAVYDHARRQWIPPLRWIRYDGAPEDLLLATVLGVPLIVAFGPPVDLLVIAMLAVGAIYASVRRWLPDLAEFLHVRLPEPLTVLIPMREGDGSAPAETGPRLD